jgi:chromosome segregation ATPase
LRQAHTVGLAAAAEDGGVQAAQLVPADEAARLKMMNTRSAGVEADATLRSLSDKMDKVADQVHALDVRQERLEGQVNQITKEQERQHHELGEMRSSIERLRQEFPTPEIPRQWLMTVFGALVLMLVLLVVIMVSVIR